MGVRIVWFLPLLLLAACGDKPEEPVDEILATVDGEPIYASEVNAAWSRTFSQQDAMFAGEELEDRLLKSLVASRVMARKAEAVMSDADKVELDLQVAAWREEQLVKRYLAEHTAPEPVSNDMVEEYYLKHPELFGGGQRHQFEMLKVSYRNDTALRDRALDALGNAASEKDWARYSAALNGKGLTVIHQRVVADASFDDKTLLARVRALQAGQVSPLSTAQGEVVVIRLNAVETVTPRPLIEVRDDIRRRLAPVKLRAAVKQAMDAALQDATVVYSSRDQE